MEVLSAHRYFIRATLCSELEPGFVMDQMIGLSFVSLSFINVRDVFCRKDGALHAAGLSKQ